MRFSLLDREERSWKLALSGAVLVFGVAGQAAGQSGATVLVPEFRVSYDGGTTIGVAEDTEVTLQNTTNSNVIVKTELWTQRGRALGGPYLPLLPQQTLVFNVSRLLKGDWNLNPSVQGQVNYCTSSSWRQFANPDAFDAAQTPSSYTDPAISDATRANIWDSLDSTPDDPACGLSKDGVIQSPLRGFLTIDVSNYCTNFFPDTAEYYRNDGLGTTRVSTINALLASARAVGPGLSGSRPVEVVQFDSSLDWRKTDTFYDNFYAYEFPSIVNEPGPLHSGAGVNAGWPASYQFIGDGRKPNAGRLRSLYLLEPSGLVRPGAAASFRALVFPGDFTGCAGFSCMLNLVARPSGVTTGGQVLGTASTNSFSGEVLWTVTIPPSYSGNYDFFAEVNGSCPQCSGTVGGFTCTTRHITVPVTAATGCTPNATTLCINNRFKIQVNWATSQGGGLSGAATAVATSSIGFSSGGIFWFFDATNPEMLVKVLNGCATNNRYWVFETAGTNVGFTMTVTDTASGISKSYTNSDLTLAPAIQDTQALATCP